MSDKFLQKFQILSEQLEGELYFDNLYRSLYATDASIYRILPLAIAFPKSENDLRTLIHFAAENDISLIPRTAGTSLAGQVVGEGIVVDVSKYFTQILDIDVSRQTVEVQPGVIRDALNKTLRPHGLFFAPNTSTSNRCMIGGMVGNNSSGTSSIKYGVTRDKVLEMEVLLADGTKAVLGEISAEEFFAKAKEKSAVGNIYRGLYELLKEEVVQHEIRREFPKPEIHRRNTGYAIDELIKSEVFVPGGNRFNLCKLLCGSEGTLAFTTRIKLRLDILPPPETAMVCAHFDSIEKCLKAVVQAMQHHLDACEMMDKVVLDCTKQNIKYRESRFFMVGDPQAILMLEITAENKNLLDKKVAALLETLQQSNLSYALPVLYGPDTEKALDLRKAGLGLLGNIVGDVKTLPCIEDTAVAVEDLSDYITEFTTLMDSFGQKAVYYAHAGAGELHLRPVLNLKKSDEVALFVKITHAVADLVKKYRGSMSGEHGDGIVRGSLIEKMIGSENYQLLVKIKSLFDPKNIFNRGKIIQPLPIDKQLRYAPDRTEPEIKTLMDFSPEMGILRAVEQCNGSGDCRKPEIFGGTMCPSYRVTKDEKDTTRGRANVLREFLTQSRNDNPFSHNEIKSVMEFCIGCKGCKSECPSNVDMASFKAEFQYQYQKKFGAKWRDRLFADNYKFNKKAKNLAGISNFLLTKKITSTLIKSVIGVSPHRTLPKVSPLNIFEIHQRLFEAMTDFKKEIWFFVDEFTETTDTQIGRDALHLLRKLGYKVLLASQSPSGRAYISKGFLEEAKQFANHNVSLYKNLVTPEKQLIGLEPSAILTFRDEYLRLADDKEAARKLAENTFTIEEFLNNEIEKGNISKECFSKEKKHIKLHLHCHQKALSSVMPTFNLLNLPENFKVTVIPSGCCGMAGSFGYEKEHYDISMQMGNLTLFPAIKKADTDVIIAATGTSCRHQIYDGTQRTALHPVSILRAALK